MEDACCGVICSSKKKQSTKCSMRKVRTIFSQYISMLLHQTKKFLHTPCQDGGIGRYAFASWHNQKKGNNQFKNKKQPELAENWTIWKSGNKGVKEVTFIQTSRRGREGQPGWRGHIAKWQLEDWVVPHSGADKPGGTTREWDRPCNPGFQCQKNKASKPPAIKILWGL